MQRFGTVYGGWYLPRDICLDSNSIIYSIGAGEDISFDLQIQSNFNSYIYIYDPTPRAIVHFDNVKRFYDDKQHKFPGDIQRDYLENINDLKVDFSKMKFINKGIHITDTAMKFYRQDNNRYVSQSLEPNMFGSDFDVVNVSTLKNELVNNGHSHIDVLKMDIEGSECDVLNNMINDGIFPKYLCIEFDLYLKNKDSNRKTDRIINKLFKCGYKILQNDNFEITFEKVE
mgnify:CR=1 FL=1